MRAEAPLRAGVDVLSLILVLLLVWSVLTVFLAWWTAWIQSYIYTESADGILWRAPAAGSVVMLTILLWVFLDYRAPERYAAIWEVSPVEDHHYPMLIVPQRDGKEFEYKRVRSDRGYVYMRRDRPLPTRPDKVIAVTDTKERIAFEPDRDSKGKFKVADGQSLKYRAATGEVMEEGQLGSVRTFYPGRLVANLLLNFLHLAAWFGCLWLLLRFQWSHAFGMAVVLWGMMLLFILPQLFKLTEKTANPAAKPRQQIAWQARQGNPLDGGLRTG
jgi:hypothetical protein